MTTQKPWRSRILQLFSDESIALYTVTDPDHLLLDSVLIAELERDGLSIITYEDPVEFRYRYESDFRKTDGRVHSQRLLIRIPSYDRSVIPFDVLQNAHWIELGMVFLFPGLSASVLRELNSSILNRVDALWDRLDRLKGDRETADFLLSNVFGIDVERIASPEAFIQSLFYLHNKHEELPPSLLIRLEEHVRKIVTVATLPVADWISSAQAFYDAMQHLWDKFIKRSMRNHVGHLPATVAETLSGHDLPLALFASPMLRDVLADAFNLGKLQVVVVEETTSLPTWCEFGVDSRAKKDKSRRVSQMRDRLTHGLSRAETPSNWMEYASSLGEFIFHSLNGRDSGDPVHRTHGVEDRVDQAFACWLEREYAGLVTLPPLPKPTMVHHIPEYLASRSAGSRLALLVMDGMSFVQWFQIRDYLKRKNLYLNFDESAVFAWLPTITSISRQALLSGEKPYYFASSWSTTAREETFWRAFWENHGYTASQSWYEKGLGLRPFDIRQHMPTSSRQSVALVIDIVDKMMHRSMMGLDSIRAELDIWLHKGFLSGLIDDLFEEGFDVFLTADHGNREAIGVGNVQEGVLAVTRGERVRIYQDRELRDRAASGFRSIPVSHSGLPPGLYALSADVGEAFVTKGEVIVGHGGMALLEIVVPWIHVLRDAKF